MTVWPPGLPHAPFAIGTEYGGTADPHENDPRITSPTRLPPFIGCAYQRGSRSRTRSPCCRTKSSTEVRPCTWDPLCLCQFSQVDGRCALWSVDTSRLLVPPVRLSTVGSRAFPVAGPRVWNALSEEITSSSSQMIFRRRLKAWLFRKSFPDIIIWLTLTLLTFLFYFANLGVALYLGILTMMMMMMMMLYLLHCIISTIRGCINKYLVLPYLILTLQLQYGNSVQIPLLLNTLRTLLRVWAAYKYCNGKIIIIFTLCHQIQSNKRIYSTVALLLPISTVVSGLWSACITGR